MSIETNDAEYSYFIGFLEEKGLRVSGINIRYDDELLDEGETLNFFEDCDGEGADEFSLEAGSIVDADNKKVGDLLGVFKDWKDGPGTLMRFLDVVAEVLDGAAELDVKGADEARDLYRELNFHQIRNRMR